MAEPENGAINLSEFAGILSQTSIGEVGPADPEAKPESEPAQVDEPEPAEIPAEDDPEGDEEVAADEDDGEDEVDPKAAKDDNIEEYEIDTPDGKVRVGKDELLKSYLRQADYTRKTQALAEREKQITESFTRYEQQAIERINALEETMLTQYQQADLTAEQWAYLKANDTDAYLLKREEMRDREAQIVATRNERLQRQQQVSLAEKQRLLKTLEDNDAILTDRIPEWKDPKAKSEIKTQLVGYLEKSGFSPEQINGITDARAVEVALKAMKWDNLQEGKPLMAKKVAAAPKMVKPGASAERGDAQRVALETARKKLRGSGKVSDLASIIYQNL